MNDLWEVTCHQRPLLAESGPKPLAVTYRKPKIWGIFCNGRILRGGSFLGFRFFITLLFF